MIYRKLIIDDVNELIDVDRWEIIKKEEVDCKNKEKEKMNDDDDDFYRE